MRQTHAMAHPREDELLAALPPPAAENLRKVLTDPELDRWVRMPTQIAFRTAMAAVDLARDRFPLPDSLTPAQRAFLEIVLERPELAPVLPGARWSLRRWLGMDPPGALERVVTHDVGGSRETSPRWRAYDAARGNPAEIARLLEALSMAERLEVYGELDAGAYGFTPRDSRVRLPRPRSTARRGSRVGTPPRRLVARASERSEVARTTFASACGSARPCFCPSCDRTSRSHHAGRSSCPSRRNAPSCCVSASPRFQRPGGSKRCEPRCRRACPSRP